MLIASNRASQSEKGVQSPVKAEAEKKEVEKSTKSEKTEEEKERMREKIRQNL